jgi:hypothetical protein
MGHLLTFGVGISRDAHEIVAEVGADVMARIVRVELGPSEPLDDGTETSSVPECTGGRY